MARQPWSEFVRNHPCAHLVVAFLDIDDIGTRRMRAMRDVLVSTIRRLAPSAIYGVTIVRAKGHRKSTSLSPMRPTPSWFRRHWRRRS
jgi:hypothetical protein